MKKPWLFWSIIFLFLIAITLVTCINRRNKQIMHTNPLLSYPYQTPDHVPPFDKIKTKDYWQAFKMAIRLHNKEIRHIINNPDQPTFQNTIVAFDKSGLLLDLISLTFDNLNEAATNPQMQKLSLKVSKLLSKHWDKIYMNRRLFKRIQYVYNQRSKLHLNEQDSMLLVKIYREFVNNGALLNNKQKNKLKKINKQLAVLSLKFGQHVLAEVDRYKLVVSNPKDLHGLPKQLIAQAAQTAEKDGLKGKWVFTLHRSVITPFLTYCRNRKLREEIFKAYITKCDHNDSLDNKAIVNQMVNLRLEKAKILGYKTWADYVLADRMAKNPKNVYDLLDTIWDKALPVAKYEAYELQSIIDSSGQKFKLMPWDWWFYAEKLRKQKYDLDESELRPYFEINNVLKKGVFYTANRLYGLTFRKADDLPVYAPGVVAYRVYQGVDSLLGILYLDLYHRPNKSGGAWTTEFRPEFYQNGKRVPPVVSIVCNFSAPTDSTPALLNLEEVRTLFHEFGHALHSLLSTVPYRTLSGTNVALDFVELPSQIMEQFAISPKVLKVYARNYKTGQPMPDTLIAKIQHSRYFNQGFATVEYMAAAYLDMAWHTITQQKKYNVDQFEKLQMQKIHLIPQIVERYRSTYFNHIFADGYSAGYYAYLWADVLVYDAFDYFRQHGLFDPQIALKFRHLLEKGGSVDPMKLYIQFRGRKPSVEAYFEAKGFVKPQNQTAQQNNNPATATK